jgi:hypothetical protein
MLNNIVGKEMQKQLFQIRDHSNCNCIAGNVKKWAKKIWGTLESGFTEVDSSKSFVNHTYYECIIFQRQLKVEIFGIPDSVDQGPIQRR